MIDRSAFHGQENSVYLPYRRLNFFFGEYEWVCKSRGILKSSAGASTFRSAWTELKKDKLLSGIRIKFNGGKGSFDKCEICHNAEQLLARKCWSSQQVDIIKTYRRHHIRQQFDERLKLQTNIANTYKCDSAGQPTSCLLFSDGMTAVKGNTPKKGARSSKGETNHITSRIIGVEVHCGPVHGTFLYYTDNLTSGGANIIIEVTRQAILDLQVQLQKHRDVGDNPMDVPRHLILQFDNCPENKNKFVFAYIALLVQERHFEVVEIFFLIVGHTHASIDQYFSVLSREIWKCEFIGSPLALEALLAKEGFEYSTSTTAWTNSDDVDCSVMKAAPLLVRKISIVYDLNTALKPLVNNKLKYYSIPHCFRFELYHSVCVMQYAVFSTQDKLLPLRPVSVPDLKVEKSLDCAVRFLSLVGGYTVFTRSCGADENVDSLSIKNKSTLQVSWCCYILNLSYIVID